MDGLDGMGGWSDGWGDGVVCVVGRKKRSERKEWAVCLKMKMKMGKEKERQRVKNVVH